MKTCIVILCVLIRYCASQNTTISVTSTELTDANINVTITTVFPDEYGSEEMRENEENEENVSESETEAENTHEEEGIDGEEQSFRPPQDPAEFMDYFEGLMQNTRQHLEEIFEQLMPQLLRMSSSFALSPECTFDAIRILFGLRQLKPWAIRIIDASGKIPDGILGGTLTALGSYDECLGSRIGDENEEYDDEENIVAKGQYCAINIKPFLPPKPPFNVLQKAFDDAADAKGFPKENHFARIAPLFYYLKLRLGLCIPSSCSLDDLNLITNSLSQRFRLNVTVQSCDVSKSITIEPDQIIPLCVITCLLLIVVIATAADIIKRSRCPDSVIASLRTRFWLSFSAFTNSRRILSTKLSDDAIKSVYGMRVLSLIWIIIANTYLSMDFRVTGRLFVTQSIPKGLLFQIVLNASLAIETFFFLSGFLVTYNTLKKINSSAYWGKNNWILFYFHRYIRMTPAIMILLLILFAAYRVGDGPLWKELIYPSVDKCKDNWWKHLFYISNFYHGKSMCFIHLWYIAADMQLFIFTPFLITFIHRKPKAAKVVIIVLITASVVCTGVVTYMQKLAPTLLFNNPDPSSRIAFGNYIFVKPYPHVAPYLIGMLTGYLLYKNPHIKLTKTVAYIGWIMSLIIILTEVFTTWEWNRGHVPDDLISAFYASLFRLCWACSIAWIIVACHNGFGGIINCILSLSVYVPMSRISYMAYLIHPGLMYIFVASTRNIFAFSHYFVMQMFFSHITTTFVVSFILALIIEYPFSSLEAVLHHYLLKDNLEKKIQLYSVNPQTASSSSHDAERKSSKSDLKDKSLIDVNLETYNAIDHIMKSDAKYIYTGPVNVSPNGHGSNLVYNYRL